MSTFAVLQGARVSGETMKLVDDVEEHFSEAVPPPPAGVPATRLEGSPRELVQRARVALEI